ncbi:hypothetical protein ACIRF8_04690 [Streptomyces sp. NPDC102406]|uniref:hypothetical protein n=1 Tax=Streptomyces sp. NPDC102406 TaxID=3366171 RepID=UPI00381274CF
MGELRRISRQLRRSRTSRVLAAGGVAALVVTGAVACQPVDGELNTVTVAATTDSQATQELTRTHAEVAWLSCTGTYSTSSTPSSSSPSEVSVDCRGKTKDGKDITVKGQVYGVVPDKCVRGDVIARVDNKVWFRVQVLGNCAATNTTTYPPAPPPEEPAHQEPQPGATRTVTETVTVREPDPNCSCFEGK